MKTIKKGIKIISMCSLCLSLAGLPVIANAAQYTQNTSSQHSLVVNNQSKQEATGFFNVVPLVYHAITWGIMIYGIHCCNKRK